MHKKLFIVDDDASMNKLYDRFLRPTLETVGVEVRIFFSPEEVLEAVEKDGMPNMLLTDDRMPYMTGRELATELRKRGYTGKILMVSGTADESVLGLGVDELMEKPVNVAALRQSVNSLLG